MSEIITKTIKGQALVMNDALVQDQIILESDGSKTVQYNKTAIIIANVWTDLQSMTGTWKTNNKGYWYWEVKQSTIEDPDTEVTVRIECPKPEPELWLNAAGTDYDFEEKTTDSDWTKFWKAKMKATNASKYYGVNALVQKEIFLPGTKYITWKGEEISNPDKTVTRDGDSLLDNLLISMY